MRVLGIETSCDETGIAIYDSHKGLLANLLHSQTEIHAYYGGVVPELASRDHIRKITPLLQQALTKSGLELTDIDGIAYTAGPGLLVALMVGAAFARSLGWALKVPTVGVHHLEAHLLACLLEDKQPELPFIALLVSGGHTLLAKVPQLGVYEILGETLDDAVGEAFDKVAKVLGCSYPGGPALAALAETGDVKRFHFPRPMLDRPGFDFSFSGLKTFTLNLIRQNSQDMQTRSDIARGFENAVVETLTMKSKRALEQTNIPRLVVAGGVGANLSLRYNLQQMVATIGAEVFYPRIEFCTDNGAMTAFAGYQRLKGGGGDPPTINVTSRWALDELTAIVEVY